MQVWYNIQLLINETYGINKLKTIITTHVHLICVILLLNEKTVLELDRWLNGYAWAKQFEVCSLGPSKHIGLIIIPCNCSSRVYKLPFWPPESLLSCDQVPACIYTSFKTKVFLLSFSLSFSNLKVKNNCGVLCVLFAIHFNK